MRSEVAPGRLRILALPATWHLLSLVAGAAFLIFLNRDQWFFQDEWGFLAHRSVSLGPGGLFEPHNEHWSTTPILTYRLLVNTVGLTSYVPYVAVVILLHLAVVHLVWRIALRAEVQPWIATAFCAAFIPFGPGADNLLWGFQVGFVGSVAVGLAALMLEDDVRTSPRLLATRWGTSVWALTFSGISVPVVAGASVAAWLRRGWKGFLVAASVPAGVYLIWLLSVGRSGLGAVPVSSETLGSTPGFLLAGLDAALSLGTPTLLTGLVPITLSVAAVLFRMRRGLKIPHAAIAAAIGELLLLAVFAIGRSGLGPEGGSATRYVYMAGALLLPIMLVGLSDMARGRRIALILVMALALPWGVNNARLLIETSEQEADRERIIRAQYVAAARFDPDEVLRPWPEPNSSPTLSLEDVRMLLPENVADLAISREALLRATLALQVSVTLEPHFAGTEVPVSSLDSSDAELHPTSPGCVTAVPTGLSPHVLVPVAAPSSYGILPASSQDLWFRLSGKGIAPDYATMFRPRPGVLSFLNVGIDAARSGADTLIVALTAPLRICEVGAEGADSRG